MRDVENSLTEDQRYFMSILRETGFIRLDQVLPLLRISEPDKEPGHAGAMLRRLQYLGLLTKAGGDMVCLPGVRNQPPDRERLLALDVLLALKPARLLQVSAQQPYPLCFLLQRPDGWIGHFAVMPVPMGHEGRISQLLQAETKDYVFLLLLDSVEQHRQITLGRDHFFVLRQGGSFRFYKGGEAGR